MSLADDWKFYVACAQISVTGGSGSLSGSLSIPGHVKETDPGYTANVRVSFHLTKPDCRGGDC